MLYVIELGQYNSGLYEIVSAISAGLELSNDVIFVALGFLAGFLAPFLYIFGPAICFLWNLGCFFGLPELPFPLILLTCPRTWLNVPKTNKTEKYSSNYIYQYFLFV